MPLKRSNLKGSIAICIKRALGLMVLAILLLITQGSSALRAQGKKSPIDTSALLTLHNYPFYALINQDMALQDLIIRHKPLKKISIANIKAMRKDLKHGKLAQAIQDIQITPAQTKEVLKALVALNDKNDRMTASIKEIKASNLYTGYLGKGEADSTFIANMIKRNVQGMGYVLQTYIFGGKPTYSKIDAISIDFTDLRIRQIFKDSLLHWSKDKSANLFYYMELKTALLALRLNGRTESMLYDPLTGGMNAKPFKKIKQTDFAKYKYSAILVPGLGPEKPAVRLTMGGKSRCSMAVEEFKKGAAPFLIVSGGHVHPNKTPFCEAVEMKKYLVDSLHMDEASVLIEPYARHTTTNLRNAARLIKLLGMPFDQPLLIVTDKSQSAYINKGMYKVSMHDLGYAPYTDLTVLSPTLTSFRPTINSLMVNPLDPLDP